MKGGSRYMHCTCPAISRISRGSRITSPQISLFSPVPYTVFATFTCSYMGDFLL